jgi:DNA-binding GntR family transcriptional regulator
MTSQAAARINHKDLNTQVYEILVDRLVTRELEANQSITISAVAEELGVSRSPVHQALTRLASENLVDLVPRKGYFVRPITTESVEQAFDVRLALETVAAERTVGTVSDAQLGELRQLMEATLPLLEGDRIVEKRKYVQANQRFHLFQVGLAGNDLLSMYYGQLSLHLVMGRVARLRDAGMDHIVREHQELVDAFEADDLERVQNAIRTHIASGKRVASEEIETAGGAI